MLQDQGLKIILLGTKYDMPKEYEVSFIKKKVHLLMPDEVQYLHFNDENITNVQFSVLHLHHF